MATGTGKRDPERTRRADRTVPLQPGEASRVDHEAPRRGTDPGERDAASDPRRSGYIYPRPVRQAPMEYAAKGKEPRRNLSNRVARLEQRVEMLDADGNYRDDDVASVKRTQSYQWERVMRFETTAYTTIGLLCVAILLDVLWTFFSLYK